MTVWKNQCWWLVILKILLDTSTIETILKINFRLVNELVVDEGEDGCTTVDAAMLINVGGSAEGVQTELYDSGASRHMSPY